MPEKKLRILEIVEDEVVLLKALSSQFKSDEFHVLTAHDGEEGLEMALNEHPDVILLDILMPKMDGITMLKRLRADKWGKTVPVIILTVVKDDKRVAEALELGAYDYLVKSDYHISEVVSKVKQRLKMKTK